MCVCVCVCVCISRIGYYKNQIGKPFTYQDTERIVRLMYKMKFSHHHYDDISIVYGFSIKIAIQIRVPELFCF